LGMKSRELYHKPRLCGRGNRGHGDFQCSE
jgi:hypothetical protein